MLRSIILPLFNEENRVRRGIESIQRFLGAVRSDYEVVLVDDGSTDMTVELASELIAGDHRFQLLSYSENRGKGHTVKIGMLEARGKTRLFCDIDMSVPVEVADKFCETVEGGPDVVIGTRSHRGSQIVCRQAPLREVLGKGYRSISRWFFSRRVSDFTCGFKAFSDEAAVRLFSASRLNRWAFDTEILFLASRWGLAVGEIPVSWTNEPNTRVQMSRDIIGSIAELASIRLYRLLKLYERPKPSSATIVEFDRLAARFR